MLTHHLPDEGLQSDGTTLSQIPTYVTRVPNGSEKGLYMAVDLGGTNFRVCSVRLNGDTTFSLTQRKVKIPADLMTATDPADLFDFLALQIEEFLKEHHEDHYTNTIVRREHHVRQGDDTKPVELDEDVDIFNLGFTFSFPVLQHGINHGNLMRWTKGFDITAAVGQDVCALLQKQLTKRHLPVRVAALVNDTVGTLMARSYTAPGKTNTLLGAIFGTGTNGAYVERLDAIAKLFKDPSAAESFDKSAGIMVVNTEWGSFDNPLAVLPNTQYDQAVDALTPNPGLQMFEKRVSGMFLGEIFRQALVEVLRRTAEGGEGESAVAKDDVPLIKSAPAPSAPDGAPLMTPWAVDTSFLSDVLGASDDVGQMADTVKKTLGVVAEVGEAEVSAVKELARAVGRRAARLSAVAIGAIVVKSGRLKEGNGEVDVGVDGSLVEFFPGFEGLIREA